MSRTVALLRHSAWRWRGVVLGLALVLAAFQLLMVVAGLRLEQTGAFHSIESMLPPLVRQAFGDTLVAFLSFQGIVCFGYFHPIVLAALAALVIATATEPASEIETGFVDLVLARPLRRAGIVWRSTILLAASPAVVVAAMIAGTEIGLALLAPPGLPPPRARVIASLALNLWGLLVCVGSIALAVTAASRRRGAAAAVAGVATFALYLAEYLSRFYAPARAIAWLSPFHYLDGMGLILGRPLPFADLAVLLGAATTGVGVAHLLFARRDL